MRPGGIRPGLGPRPSIHGMRVMHSPHSDAAKSGQSKRTENPATQSKDKAEDVRKSEHPDGQGEEVKEEAMKESKGKEGEGRGKAKKESEEKEEEEEEEEDGKVKEGAGKAEEDKVDEVEKEQKKVVENEGKVKKDEKEAKVESEGENEEKEKQSKTDKTPGSAEGAMMSPEQIEKYRLVVYFVQSCGGLCFEFILVGTIST